MGITELSTLPLLFALAGPAAACPFPQVLIRHLGECVSPRSKLARAYVSIRADPWRFRHSTPVIAPEPALRPIHPLYWPADAPSIDKPISVPLPDLQTGAPVFWRLCKEHPSWCKNEGIHPDDK
jgi:hypothetical protein